MWCYVRMLKAKWTDKIRNKNVLEQTDKGKSFWSKPSRRTAKLAVHKLRYHALVN